MRKARTHFEQVPIEEVMKVIRKEQLSKKEITNRRTEAERPSRKTGP